MKRLIFILFIMFICLSRFSNVSAQVGVPSEIDVSICSASDLEDTPCVLIKDSVVVNSFECKVNKLRLVRGRQSYPLLDTTPPVTTISPAEGTYNAIQSVTFSANEPATIYYTTNGNDPTITSPVYSGPIQIIVSTIVKFFARDMSGNSETVKTAHYTINSVIGVCGTANGTTLTSPPNSNLCMNGTASAVAGVGPWYWTCSGTNGGTTASCSAQIQTWSLTLLIAGNGGGSVNGDVSCVSGTTCPFISFPHGTTVTLSATPNTASTFDGWSGACSTSTDTCTVTMNAAKTVTATFSAAPKVKVGTKMFSNLQMAYDDAGTTNGSVIKMLEGRLAGNCFISRDIAVKLEGGYNSTYDFISTKTTVQGTVKIKAGTVRVRGVNVK